MKKPRRAWHILAFIGVFAAGIAVVMLLWNAIIPSVIGWSAISYWQAAGLMILTRLLFGGLGSHWGWGKFAGQDKRHKALHEKLRNMSRDEKREFIRSRMRGDGGFDGWDEPSDSEENK